MKMLLRIENGSQARRADSILSEKRKDLAKQLEPDTVEEKFAQSIHHKQSEVESRHLVVAEISEIRSQ